MKTKRILKNIVYHIIRTFWLRKGTVRTVPVGPYQSIRFELSAIMQRRIEVFFRAYEPNVTAWLEQTIKPGMTVYVVGAHVGIHVLYIARLLQGQGHIYAFEGWPENFALLQRNIALNDHLETGITSVQSVVSEKSGKINMASGGSDGKHHIAAAAQTNHNQIEADGISLPVIEATCRYQQPARYDDELEIRTAGRMASGVRVEFSYELVRLADLRVLATARTLHVPVTRDGRPCRLPVALREIFA